MYERVVANELYLSMEILVEDQTDNSGRFLQQKFCLHILYMKEEWLWTDCIWEDYENDVICVRIFRIKVRN